MANDTDTGLGSLMAGKVSIGAIIILLAGLGGFGGTVAGNSAAATTMTNATADITKHERILHKLDDTTGRNAAAVARHEECIAKMERHQAIMATNLVLICRKLEVDCVPGN